jgi:hypothetical protein
MTDVFDHIIFIFIFPSLQAVDPLAAPLLATLLKGLPQIVAEKIAGLLACLASA